MSGANWLTLQELSIKMKCSTRKLHDMRKAKTLPKPRDFGGSLRWLESEIDEWLFEQYADY